MDHYLSEITKGSERDPPIFPTYPQRGEGDKREKCNTPLREPAKGAQSIEQGAKEPPPPREHDVTSKKGEPGSDGQDPVALEQWKQRVEI